MEAAAGKEDAAGMVLVFEKEGRSEASVSTPLVWRLRS